MTQIIRILIIALLLVIPGIAGAQVAPPVVEAVTLPGTELHTLQSALTQSDYHIYIALPESYVPGDTTTYPVVYLLDGNFFFAIMVQAYRMMRILSEEVREAIFVGIGYPVETNADVLVRRFMDQTPTRVERSEEQFTERLGKPVRSGGGQAFLRALSDEIIPFVEASYRTGPERMLAGFSLSSMFGTYVLFHEPQLFQSYLIGSPSLWWDDGSTFGFEERYASSHQSLPARVFISAGSREGTLTTSVQQLAETLAQRRYPDLELTAHVFEDETHFSVIAATLARGLSVLLAP
jgi:predicted alpha/beta superfamily hydrolase